MQISSLRDNPERRPPRWRLVVTLGLVLAAVAFSVWYFSPTGVQSRGMREARRHIDTVVGPLVRAEERFGGIELTDYTGEGGAVGVFGEVESWEDARALREMILTTHPRVPVYWGFQVKESLVREAPAAALTKRVTHPD